MSMLTIVFAVLVLAAVAVVALAVQRATARRRVVAEAKRKAEEWKAANPTLEPLTDEQIGAFERWYEQQALPAAVLTIAGPVEPAATGSHIGGAVMWPSSKPWPKGRDGQPLQFLAQIDFASLPKLQDYPEKGILQFFIGVDDLYGADFDDLMNGSFRIEWWPDGVVGGERTMPPSAEEDYTPLSPALVAQARRLDASAAKFHPTAYSMPVERHPDQVLRRENAQRVVDLIDKVTASERDVHRVGGHPDFTQHDFRDDPRFEGHDRVLLQLWSTTDRAMMWGDMGQGNFMISRKDLLARDFSRVTYHWDCC